MRDFPTKREMLRVSARLRDKRYRNDPPSLLLMSERSDIQAAGLGALAMRHRQQPREGIRRLKEQDFLTGRVEKSDE